VADNTDKQETVNKILGLLQALRLEVDKDDLSTFTELVHADLFSDFIDSALYLLSEGWKDAAAIIGGGVLEQHLKKLCAKHSIPISVPNSKGTGAHDRKLDELNIELRKANVYSNITQASITALASLRNSAAHGEHHKYDASAVRNMLDDIKQFVAQFPA
jgi:hypothetical protein